MWSICVELEAACESFETGRQYRLLRELEDDQAKAVTQKEVRTDLDREPSFVEFKKTLKEMELSAPRDDEVTVHTIRTRPFEYKNVSPSFLFTRGERRTVKENRNIGHRPFPRQLGDMPSLDNYGGVALLSMISRVLARLAISRCLKNFENLGVVRECAVFQTEEEHERRNLHRENCGRAVQRAGTDA